MLAIPCLETPRLELRPFSPADAPEVHRLAGDRAVAETTLTIPHPYPAGAAGEWIATHGEEFDAGRAVSFCVESRLDDALLGAISLGLETEHDRAELGYWIGRPHWGRGYATEAAEAILGYGFAKLGLNRVYAYHFSKNTASGRVLQKAGMRHEGVRRQHTLKWGEYLDNEAYGILRSEWDEKGRA